jgi:hypothetical protein
MLGPAAGPKQRYIDIRKQEVKAIMLQVGPRVRATTLLAQQLAKRTPVTGHCWALLFI